MTNLDKLLFMGAAVFGVLSWLVLGISPMVFTVPFVLVVVALVWRSIERNEAASLKEGDRVRFDAASETMCFTGREATIETCYVDEVLGPVYMIRFDDGTRLQVFQQEIRRVKAA